jgi:hypothetical protein
VWQGLFYCSTEFIIEYPCTDGVRKFYRSVRGYKGALMGFPFSKELLTLATAFSSRSDKKGWLSEWRLLDLKIFDYARIVLGDDLFYILWNDFFYNSSRFGLQVHPDKCEVSSCVTIQDRTAGIFFDENFDSYLMKSSYLPAVKLFSLSGKFG